MRLLFLCLILLPFNAYAQIDYERYQIATKRYTQHHPAALRFSASVHHAVADANSVLNGFLENGLRPNLLQLIARFDHLLSEASTAEFLSGHFDYCRLTADTAQTYFHKSLAWIEFNFNQDNLKENTEIITDPTKMSLTQKIQEDLYHEWNLARQNYETLLAYCFDGLAMPPQESDFKITKQLPPLITEELETKAPTQ